MIIDLKSVFTGKNPSLRLDYLLDLSDFEYAGQFPLKKPVSLTGEITNKASLVRLLAHIEFVFDSPCDRCGKPTARKHVVTVDKSLATAIEGDDSDTILLVPDMKLDLDDFIYTETVVNAIWNWLSATPDRFPFPDLVFTSEPILRSFVARTVQGGLFINLLHFDEIEYSECF